MLLYNLYFFLVFMILFTLNVDVMIFFISVSALKSYCFENENGEKYKFLRNMVTSIPFLIARVTDDSDFLRLKELAIVHDSWHLEYNKNGIKIWSKAVSDATVKMVKVWAIFSGINSSDLYSTLMDPIYRKEWDTHMILSYDIGYLNPNNSVSYYAASCPPPLRSRDFVLQSSWLDMNTEHYILNHSISHKDHPPRAGFIRAVSYFTGYYIKAILDDGCEMTFVTQTDPQGVIPVWIVNKCTQIFAPRFVRQVEKAAYAYRAWKSQNSPNYYPWVNPEQMKAPKISIADCVPSGEERESPFFRYLLEKLEKTKTDPVLTKRDTVDVLHPNVVTPGPSIMPYGNYDSKGPLRNSQRNLPAATDVNKKGERKKR